MGKKRSSSQIERLPPTAAAKDEQPPTPALKDDEKPSPPRPEEEKEQDDEEDLSSASSSSVAEDDDDEEEDDEEDEDNSPSKNTTPPANSHPKPKTEDDSDSEDEEETDSEEEPAPKLKSLNSNSNSKPLELIKSKAEPKPSAGLARSGGKRPADNDPKQAKKMKTAEEDNKKSGDDSKKLFQRVFNEDDEMAIIKGLHDFITKTETDPFKYLSAFYEFVKKSIHVKVTLEQLRDKIRRLKQKYETKIKSKKTPNFSKQNDRIMFELSHKIWGGKLNVTEAEEKGKSNGKLSKKEPAAKKPRTTKKLVLEPDLPMVVKETREVERTDTEKRPPSLALHELIRFDESVSASRVSVGAMKRGMELIEESEREELARRWEKVQIAELEVFKMRADLAVDQAMTILDALKSSSSD